MRRHVDAAKMLLQLQACSMAEDAGMPVAFLLCFQLLFSVRPSSVVIHPDLLAHFYTSTRIFQDVQRPTTPARPSMCEFCSFAPNSSRQNHGEDAFGMGFFSADAIEAAVRQATEAKQRKAENSDEQGDGEDDDGT